MTRKYDNVVHWLISGSGSTGRSCRTLVSSYVGMGVSGLQGPRVPGSQGLVPILDPRKKKAARCHRFESHSDSEFVNNSK